MGPSAGKAVAAALIAMSAAACNAAGSGPPGNAAAESQRAAARAAWCNFGVADGIDLVAVLKPQAPASAVDSLTDDVSHGCQGSASAPAGREIAPLTKYDASTPALTFDLGPTVTSRDRRALAAYLRTSDIVASVETCPCAER